MKALLKKLFYIPEYKEIDANYILSDSIREQYNEQGYVVVKNIIEDSALTIIEATYKNLISNSDLDKSDFITSPNYGRALQIETQQRLSQVNAKILSKIFNLEKCYFDFFSILVLKSKLQQKYLSAHQDISFVDEKLGTTTFLWIPIDDIVEENGPITVLPKSHIWARWQKTHNRQISPLVKNNLWI
ncbi:MAG: phytanoyl-CoA dioxygenase family protein, partial [Bacteroidetes bacterium]|nr:phytanoyl-CoA dioxygenase family protein [Bacteroidota bacterium]